jgi:hypothetical protein
MEPRHERIAKIALAAGARYGLALAGGYAVSAHGMGTRPSGDVDLFTGWQHRSEFPELKAAVIAALESAGYKVSVIMSAETFTRLTLTDPEGGAEEKVELSVDWRAHEPVQLAPSSASPKPAFRARAFTLTLPASQVCGSGPAPSGRPSCTPTRATPRGPGLASWPKVGPRSPSRLSSGTRRRQLLCWRPTAGTSGF